MSGSSDPSGARPPLVAPSALDELWFQVGGTLCNLACHHCFISCHPSNDNFGFLDLATVERYLEESRALGVKEYYFTGGEPFLNREIIEMLERALALGPATVLTNGTVFTARILSELRRIAQSSRYSLEIRVSIDGHCAEMNDPIRGEGTFARAMDGVRQLVERGFLPIITVAQTWPEEESERVFDAFVARLRAAGCTRPRIKVLPALRIGMEARRTRGYVEEERITREMLEGYDVSQLLCSRGRTVTDRGVAVCPILIEAEDAHLGATLHEAMRPFAVRHGACSTCYLHGAICSNPSGRGAS